MNATAPAVADEIRTTSFPSLIEWLHRLRADRQVGRLASRVAIGLAAQAVTVSIQHRSSRARADATDTCIAMLLHGKPLVHLPHFLEQGLFAKATERIGVSVTAQPREALGTRNAILKVVEDPSYARAADVFRDRYCTHNVSASSDQIVDQMVNLVAS
jgi:hypothetical protein